MHKFKYLHQLRLLGMISKKQPEYLKYLERKEEKILFSIKKLAITHGHISIFLRTLKGMVLGFGIANIFIQTVRNIPLFYYLLFLVIMFGLSVLLIHHERRHYKRKGWENSLKVCSYILLACFLVSLLVFIYSDYTGFFTVLAVTLFFSSLTYSME